MYMDVNRYQDLTDIPINQEIYKSISINKVNFTSISFVLYINISLIFVWDIKNKISQYDVEPSNFLVGDIYLS